jgi:hypothetical protein
MVRGPSGPRVAGAQAAPPPSLDRIDGRDPLMVMFL